MYYWGCVVTPPVLYQPFGCLTIQIQISRPNVCGVPQVDLSNDMEAIANLPDTSSFSFNGTCYLQSVYSLSL